MKDNNEDGSRPAASALQQSAPDTSPTVPQAGQHGTGTTAPAQLSDSADTPDSGDDSELRPVSADMQQFIGRQLRAVFDDVAKQPVPDRFLELMKQLDSKTAGR